MQTQKEMIQNTYQAVQVFFHKKSFQCSGSWVIIHADKELLHYKK